MAPGATPRSFRLRLARMLGCGSVLWFALLATMTGAAAQNPIGYEEAADIGEVVVTAEPGAGGLEISRGWAVESEGACYVIATRHGVYHETEGPFDNIVIRGVRENGVTQIQRSATLTRAFDADLALLRLSERECPFSLPSEFKPPPDDSRAWILRPFDVGYGREFREVRSLFTFLTPDEYVARVPTNESAIPTGWSGSTVFLGNKRVGMVRAVNPDGLSVIFYTQRKIQDEIEDYLTVFGSEPLDERSWSDRIGETFRNCPACPEMLVVPAGSFMMGSPETEEGHRDDEGPQHLVRIGKPFAVGRFEVTRDQFDTFVRATGHSVGSSCRTYENEKYEDRSGLSYDNPGFSQSGDHPVVCVNWNDAKAYAEWLGKKTRQRYRLLSEAEWEYVARAGSPSRFSFGDQDSALCRHGNGADQSTDFSWRNESCNDGYTRTAPIGSFAGNEFKIHDMHGNVWEWTEDCWNDSYEGAPEDGAAWTEGECSLRVLRGGSWGNIPGNLRSGSRSGNETGYRYDDIGVRVARTLDR